MNANERDMIYQTDTSPVLLPDFSRDREMMLECCELAFAAFNGPDWTELLVRVPTSIADDIDVHHYSRPVRFDCKNLVIHLL